jgi:hypothetical protein
MVEMWASMSPQLLFPSPYSLHSFFKTPSLQAYDNTTTLSFENTSPSVQDTAMSHTPHLSKQFHTGLHVSFLPSNQLQQAGTSVYSDLSMSGRDIQPAHFPTNGSSSSSKELSVSTASSPKQSATLLPPTSSSKWFTSLQEKIPPPGSLVGENLGDERSDAVHVDRQSAGGQWSLLRCVLRRRGM